MTQKRTPNHQTTKGAPKTTRSRTGRPRFPLNNFKYFLTLFSKFFSSFPHGTCTLSVSPQYLALDETYHLIRAALPSNPTLWTWRRAQGPHVQRRDSHPLWYPVSKDLWRGPSWQPASKPQLRHPQGITDFQFELFPLHSPLLGESLLVSFPPLINMLKFRGFSHLSRDLVSLQFEGLSRRAAVRKKKNVFRSSHTNSLQAVTQTASRD